mgnify:CR=1 FL=1
MPQETYVRDAYSPPLEYTTVTYLQVCSAPSGAVLAPHFHRALSLLSLLAAPALATTGLGSASELIPRPASPRFQCWLLWSFQVRSRTELKEFAPVWSLCLLRAP